MPSWRLGTAGNLKLYFHTTPHLIVKEGFICTSSRQVLILQREMFPFVLQSANVVTAQRVLLSCT
jgi:hypothetical protein